jgi:hypothetical protein
MISIFYFPELISSELHHDDAYRIAKDESIQMICHIFFFSEAGKGYAGGGRSRRFEASGTEQCQDIKLLGEERWRRNWLARLRL